MIVTEYSKYALAARQISDLVHKVIGFHNRMWYVIEGIKMETFTFPFTFSLILARKRFSYHLDNLARIYSPQCKEINSRGKTSRTYRQNQISRGKGG